MLLTLMGSINITLASNSAYLTTDPDGFTKQFIDATMIEVVCERINTLFGLTTDPLLTNNKTGV